MNKVTFNISGLHCASCKTLLEAEVGAIPGVKKIIVIYEKGRAGVEYDENETDLDKIFNKIKELGYTPELLDITATGKKTFNKNWLWAGIFVLVFAAGYFLIETFGGWSIMANLNNKNIGLGLIFIIGLLASFHCVGMCGGFIMAYSTRQLKITNDKLQISSHKLHLQYNLGRLISYTVIGGILGGFGSFFGINPDFSGALLLVAAVFMVLMGLGLATEIKWLDRIKLRMPDFVAKIIFKNRQTHPASLNPPRLAELGTPPERGISTPLLIEGNKPKGPFVIGLLTGFMPCGPLQAMQLYALSTGNWLSGALAMGVYALGTIPLLFGFGSFVSMLTASRMKQLLRISGIIVIILGLFTFSRALNAFGLLNPAPQNNQTPAAPAPAEAQTVEMTVSYSGYQPNVIYIKKGMPVHWIINLPKSMGCTDAIILYNGQNQISQRVNIGQTIIDFTPESGVSEIKFSCGMKMVWGKFVIN
ncbi:MAG TPA: sulfite exporter TauE/SafE family protein [Candidatus Nanoarchaeia archaeon]|nr:sulfite exporter TauE/SafE family protein [Candidatus Nanoarchaeia archaeon]